MSRVTQLERMVMSLRPRAWVLGQVRHLTIPRSREERQFQESWFEGAGAVRLGAPQFVADDA